MTLHNLSLRSFVLAATFCATAFLAAQAQQSSDGKSNASTGGQKQSAEVRTEKFKVKQEFGPQTTAPRGDRTNTSTTPGQNGGSNASGNNDANSSASEFKQEFGPQVVGSRKDRAATAAPPSASGQGNGQSQQNPSLFQPDGTPTRATAALANPGAKPQTGTTGSSGKSAATTPNSTKSQGANPQ
jgi:hypothetical protein